MSSRICEYDKELLKDNMVDINQLNTPSVSFEHNFTNLSIIKEISKIAYPTALFFFTIAFQQTISLSFIGKKYNNPKIIDAMGISQLYINCFLLWVSMGLTTAMDTLCSNAYGAKKYYLMGLYLHRIRIITYLITILLSIFHYFFAIKILKLFKLDPEVYDYIEEYIYYLILYNLFDIQFSVNFRFLGILQKNTPCIIIIIITTCLNPLWCYLFIDILDFGVKGAGMAISLSQLLNMVLSSIFVHVTNPLPEAYFCFNKDCIRGLGKVLKFSIPAAIMFCSEGWAFEVQAIFAIYLGALDYSVHIIAGNVSLLLYTTSLGFSIGTTITVGKYLTMTDTKNTKKVCFIALGFAFCNVAILSSLVILFHKYIIEFYIKDEIILEKAIPIIILVGISEFFDVVQTNLAAIFRAFGKHIIASFTGIFQFYIFQSSMSYVYAYVFDFKVFGIWLSYTNGFILAIIIYLLIIYFNFNIEKIKEEALERLDIDNEQIKNFT